VSIFILSHIFTKSGTGTTSHDDRVAGFFHPVAVSHFSPGGVSITSRTIEGST
jgi:hypothetical protein